MRILGTRELHKDQTIAIIGQGYVGKETALACLSAGYSVVGVDTDKSVVESIQKDKRFKGKRYRVSAKYSDAAGSDTFIISVPTPLLDGKPDYAYVRSALSSVAPLLSNQSLVSLESTVGIGFSRNEAVPLLTKLSRDSVSSFYFVYAPERISPGDVYRYEDIPRVIAGLSSVDRSIGNSFYSTIVSKTTMANSLEDAEASKLLENSFRLVNISFINQFSEAMSSVGINARDIVELSGSKPFGYMPFYPGAGVGGHCIPVDPLFLAASVKKSIPILDQSVKYNDSMPGKIVNAIVGRLENVSGRSIAIVGVSYKPNGNDDRESVGFKVFDMLESLGANVYWVDDMVSTSRPGRSKNIKAKTDLAVIVVKHFSSPKIAIPFIDVSEGLKLNI